MIHSGLNATNRLTCCCRFKNVTNRGFKFIFLIQYIFFIIGKSLYVDRLFEKFQHNSPRAKHIRIRLTEPCIDIDSLIKNLSEKLAPLREQDPVLLHIDTAGVSMQACISTRSLFYCTVFFFIIATFSLLPGSYWSGGALIPSVSSGLFE